jgi:mono/diheme cytochrome c family protein
MGNATPNGSGTAPPNTRPGRWQKPSWSDILAWLMLIALVVYGLRWLAIVAMHGDSSASEGLSTAAFPTSLAEGRQGTGALYRQGCARCHGTDGKGGEVRAETPQIPDFTSGAWQAQRRDVQLRTSILYGRGKVMPPFSDKITPPQAQDLVAYVRQMAPDRSAWAPPSSGVGAGAGPEVAQPSPEPARYRSVKRGPLPLPLPPPARKSSEKQPSRSAPGS